MSKKHILTVSALALAALILIGVFVYCLPLMISEGEERQEDKSEDEIVFERADESEEKTQTERATYDPFFDPTREVIPIEDVDFEDEEISILYNDHVLSAREWHKLIPEDELDEAVARRNEEVQEALGVNVVWHPIAYNGSYYSEFSARFFDLVSSYINSGIHMYDIASNFADCTASPVIRD